jgi:hypothetical protein
LQNLVEILKKEPVQIAILTTLISAIINGFFIIYVFFKEHKVSVKIRFKKDINLLVLVDNSSRFTVYPRFELHGWFPWYDYRRFTKKLFFCKLVPLCNQVNFTHVKSTSDNGKVCLVENSYEFKCYDKLSVEKHDGEEFYLFCPLKINSWITNPKNKYVKIISKVGTKRISSCILSIDEMNKIYFPI